MKIPGKSPGNESRRSNHSATKFSKPLVLCMVEGLDKSLYAY